MGLAIGDAMGAPLEGYPPPRRPVTSMTGGGKFNLISGSFTDDTLQAAAVAESLIQCGGFSARDVAGRLIRVYTSHPWFFGPTSSHAFRLILKGVPVESAAAIADQQRGGSRTNGSVMRGPPVGIFYAGGDLIAVSHACSAITHHDPVASSCSAFVNRLVSAMVRGRSRDQAMGKAIAECRIEEVSEYLVNYHRHDPEPSIDALYCTHAALVSFMTTGSFRDAVVTAVNMGGDADTLGAITGALAGARYGFRAIPAEWTAGLRGYGSIADLAGRLALAASL